MPDSAQPPFQRVLPALAASLVIFVVKVLINGYNLFHMDLSRSENDLYLIFGISWGTALLFECALNFAVLCQMQRHLRMGPPRRPLVMAATFTVLTVAGTVLWMFIYRQITSLLISQDSVSGFRGIVFTIELLLGIGFTLVSTLVWAWISVLAGGRANPDTPAASPAGPASTWIVQALTLICGLHLLSGFVTNAASFMPGSHFGSPIQQLVLTRVLPMLLDILIGVGIYALWPRRLQQLSGWALYLLGVFLAFVSVMPPAAFVVIETLLHMYHSVTWPALLAGPFYILCLLLLATITGLLFRTRKPAAEF